MDKRRRLSSVETCDKHEDSNWALLLIRFQKLTDKATRELSCIQREKLNFVKL